jgi:hypothetical protein
VAGKDVRAGIALVIVALVFLLCPGCGEGEAESRSDELAGLVAALVFAAIISVGIAVQAIARARSAERDVKRLEANIDLVAETRDDYRRLASSTQKSLDDANIALGVHRHFDAKAAAALDACAALLDGKRGEAEWTAARNALRATGRLLPKADKAPAPAPKPEPAACPEFDRHWGGRPHQPYGGYEGADCGCLSCAGSEEDFAEIEAHVAGCAACGERKRRHEEKERAEEEALDARKVGPCGPDCGNPQSAHERPCVETKPQPEPATLCRCGHTNSSHMFDAGVRTGECLGTLSDGHFCPCRALDVVASAAVQG